jgi:ribosomal protein S18 acetylase RimI-like enzyme
MEIRKLTINNYDQMTTVWTKAELPFKPRGRDSEQAIGREMTAYPDFFIGAFEGNRLVGVAILSCDARKGWINRLAIDPECRRRGIAEALIAESEKTLRKHGLRPFCALIEQDNVASKGCSENAGMLSIKTQPTSASVTATTSRRRAGFTATRPARGAG